jgi:4-aminobutyrate aminotransferase-like enzyme
MEAWPPSVGEAIHTSTFLGHPLACAAGLSLLAEMESGDLVTRSRELGLELVRWLRDELAGVPEVAEVRGRGLFVGVELADPGTMEPLAGAASVVAGRALGRGILVLPAGRVGHVLELSPPLVITREQLQWATVELGGIIRETVRGVPSSGH